MDGSEWSLGTLQKLIKDEFEICFLIFVRFMAGSAAGFGRLAGEGLQGSNASDGWVHQCFGWTHAAVMWCKGVVLFFKKRLEGSME